MSYHGQGGLGFELLTSAAPLPGTPTLSPAPSSVSAGTLRASWLQFVAVRSWLPRYRTAMARLRGRVVVADRAAALRMMQNADAALAIANAIYNYETSNGTRSFRAWSTRSIQKLGDIGRSGGIPDAAGIALVERSKDAPALRAATEVRANWTALARWQASQAPSAPLLVKSTTLRLPAPDPTAEARRRAEAERAMAESRERAAAEEMEKAREAAREAAERVADTVADVVEDAHETVEDVIRDADILPTGPLPTMEQLVPGTTAPPPSKKWLWIGAGVLGLSAVGYLILRD
jgi:hypothetical protein